MANKASDHEKNLLIMSELKNYNKWIYDNIKNDISDRVLEIGCGIGNITQFLTDKKLVVGIDINSKQINAIKNRFGKQKNLKFFRKDIINLDIRKFKKYKFDTILCLNVLEHIPNDIMALETMGKSLSKNGKLILLCPAFNFLYGTIDKANEHYRRYNKSKLIDKLTNSNFDVKNCFYFNFFGVFGWLLHSKILKKHTHPINHMLIFDKMVPLLSKLEKVLKPLIGLSIMCIAVKNGSD